MASDFDMNSGKQTNTSEKRAEYITEQVRIELARAHNMLNELSRFEIDGMPLFAHTNEIITQYFASYKRCLPSRFNDVYWLKTLSIHYAEVNVIDIGVNYGADLLLNARFMKDHLISGQIVGYEPSSRPFGLLPHTFRENGLDATFLKCAIGDRNGSMILRGVTGHSEDMRIVPHSAPDTFEVVEVRTLDSEIERLQLSKKPLFVKIDTQGAEWLVIKGGQQFFTKRDIVVRTEFTPSMTSGASGEELLTFYTNHFYVIDERTKLQINTSMCRSFSEKVAEQYCMGYTDLYLVPLESPLVKQL